MEIICALYSGISVSYEHQPSRVVDLIFSPLGLVSNGDHRPRQQPALVHGYLCVQPHAQDWRSFYLVGNIHNGSQTPLVCHSSQPDHHGYINLVYP